MHVHVYTFTKKFGHHPVATPLHHDTRAHACAVHVQYSMESHNSKFYGIHPLSTHKFRGIHLLYKHAESSVLFNSHRFRGIHHL